MASINFFFEEGAKITSLKKTLIRSWVKELIRSYNNSIECINFIFCTDEYLLSINEEYLKHDTYTDIVTFNNSSENGILEGDIFISVERVKENALTFAKDFTEELHRVIIHGILHLLGHGDKTALEKQEMRALEDKWLNQINVPRGTYK